MARFVAFVLTLCACTIFLIVGVRDLVARLSYSNVVAAAKVIERAAGNPSPAVRSLPKQIEQSVSLEAALATCLEEVSRAALTIRLFRWEEEGALDQSAGPLGDFVSNYLKCFPTDGNAWLWRARILGANNTTLTQAARAAEISYWLAPSERWIALPRFAFVSPKLDSSEFSSLRSTFEVDLRRLVHGLEPGETAELYVGSGPKIRKLMADAIGRERDPLRGRIIADIDRLGVTVVLPP